MKGCDSVHNGLCFVYFIKVDEASRTNAREKVILPIEVRNKLRETQVITTRDGHDCGRGFTKSSQQFTLREKSEFFFLSKIICKSKSMQFETQLAPYN
jgi:hypothetical protein